ncbi:MAG: GNAT family N-acetyltransferase [Planctomycetaceae bacterium]|nr:GNAT family N-acetyltransferase [Planctomycetaceae bacterium]
MTADSLSLSVRGATIGDLSAIDAFIQPFVAEGRLLPRTIDELEDLLPTGFVALRDGEVVGFAALEIYSKKLAELRSLAVADRCRGQGIGRRLVDSCLNVARERSVFEVIVITSEEQFFQGCGFDFTLPGQKKALFYKTRDQA